MRLTWVCMFVHERVVTAELAILEEWQDDEPDACGHKRDGDEGCVAADVGTATLAGFAPDAPFLRVEVVVC